MIRPVFRLAELDDEQKVLNRKGNGQPLRNDDPAKLGALDSQYVNAWVPVAKGTNDMIVEVLVRREPNHGTDPRRRERSWPRSC